MIMRHSNPGDSSRNLKKRVGWSFLGLIPVMGLLFLSASSNQNSVPQMIWPVGADLNEDVFLLMHVDNAPASGTVRDYTCGDQYAYDGHRGTDISAFNFRQMDRGIPIYAAADGTVSFVRYDQFDRNYWPPYQGDPNGLVIRHAGGSNSQYWHLRKNSVTVQVGETVQAGQLIGMIGSSGATPIPHLHFEIWDNGQFRDPFTGLCNNRPSLWNRSIRHPSDTALRVLDWDVFTKENLAGTESNNYFGETALKDRPFRPVKLAQDAPTLGVWVLLQGNFGSIYTLRILAPDESERASRQKSVSTRKGAQWHALYWNFGALTQGLEQATGSWRIELIYEGRVAHELQFEVGSTTTFGPRFYPLAGRSLRITGVEHRDRLVLSGGEAPVTFHLMDAPTNVSLDGDEVVIAAPTNPPYRNTFFQAVATDALGRTDTVYYHLVTPGKPFAAVGTDTEAPQKPARLSLEQNYPNPFRGTTRIPFSLKRSEHVTLEVYTVDGRKVATLIDGMESAGRHEAAFKADDLPSGTYIYRLRAGDQVQSGRMTVVK